VGKKIESSLDTSCFSGEYVTVKRLHVFQRSHNLRNDSAQQCEKRKSSMWKAVAMIAAVLVADPGPNKATMDESMSNDKRSKVYIRQTTPELFTDEPADWPLLVRQDTLQ
jgi:hypothetical protein